ncbi:hypothetical protein LXL04_027144 [Taraxacum kok-saghyz]
MYKNNNSHTILIYYQQIKMKPTISFVFLLLPIINVVDLVISQFPSDIIYKCRNTGNYTTRTDYARNLNVAINKVGMENKINGNFYSSSWGGNEAAHALALCSNVGTKWGANCSQCVTRLINTQIKYCPDQKEGVMWTSNCMFRYSDRKIVGVLDDWVWILKPERGSYFVSDQSIHDLATRLQREASGGTNARKAALGIIASPRKTYGAMQCTPDLSKELCRKCLQHIITSHVNCCSRRPAARMYSPNCYFVYSLQEFSKWKDGLSTDSGFALQSIRNANGTIITIT